MNIFRCRNGDPSCDRSVGDVDLAVRGSTSATLHKIQRDVIINAAVSSREVVRQICAVLEHKRERDNGRFYSELIDFFSDRSHCDRLRAIASSKAERELGWKAQHDFEGGMEKTCDWHSTNEDSWYPMRDQGHSGTRLGLI